MRAAICDMVTVARFLNLTLVVPELDKTSFWSDPSNFEDIFDVRHFIESLRDEVRIVKRLPKRFSRKYGYKQLAMPPVSWSNEKYYSEQGSIPTLRITNFHLWKDYLIKQNEISYEALLCMFNYPCQWRPRPMRQSVLHRAKQDTLNKEKIEDYKL
uniref:O-fucosyltransferase family protein n=1 Tax=Vitis vinifera TaxID=29760 RepID=A5C9N6_VITVI|nr:hypothetical protein VITISV_039632 [Vitis vinifera]